jgi:hypothetical protein
MLYHQGISKCKDSLDILKAKYAEFTYRMKHAANEEPTEETTSKQSTTALRSLQPRSSRPQPADIMHMAHPSGANHTKQSKMQVFRDEDDGAPQLSDILPSISFPTKLDISSAVRKENLPEVTPWAGQQIPQSSIPKVFSKIAVFQDELVSFSYIRKTSHMYANPLPTLLFYEPLRMTVSVN